MVSELLKHDHFLTKLPEIIRWKLLTKGGRWSKKAKKFVNVLCQQLLGWNNQNWVFRPFLWTSLSIVQKPWVELMVEFWEFSLQVQFVSGCDLLPFFVNFECYINNMNANKISPLYLIIKWDSILYAEFRIALCFYLMIF